MSSDFASEPQPAYVGKHRDPTQFANQTNVLAPETPGRHRRSLFDYGPLPIRSLVGRHSEFDFGWSVNRVVAADTWEFLYPPDPIDRLFAQLRSEVCGPSDELQPEPGTRSDR